MKIKRFDPKYTDEMVKLFQESFDEPSRKWGSKQAKHWIESNFKDSPDYCFMAVDEKENCLGIVICTIEPYYQGNSLYIHLLQIKKNYRGQGVAKALIKKVFALAKKNKINGAVLQTDNRVDFPRKWYEKMGFKPTGWEEFDIIDIKNFKL